MRTSPSVTVVGVNWECISTISCTASRSVRMFFSVNSTGFVASGPYLAFTNKLP
jgi:hypothetical protein